MKSLLPLILIITLTLQVSKTDLICQIWKQIGTKPFGKPYQATPDAMAEALYFKKDGTYYKMLYRQLKMKGKWKFNKNQSKFACEISEINGTKVSDGILDEKHPTDSLVKLTKDTLIYAELKYSGSKRIRGSDIKYFVSQ